MKISRVMYKSPPTLNSALICGAAGIFTMMAKDLTKIGYSDNPGERQLYVDEEQKGSERLKDSSTSLGVFQHTLTAT